MALPAEHPNSRKTHCPKGHPYEADNLYIDPKGYRRCRTCKAIDRATKEYPSDHRRRRRSPRTNGESPDRRTKSHCPMGHPYEGDNVYIDPKGNKRCRACKRRWRISRSKSEPSVTT